MRHFELTQKRVGPVMKLWHRNEAHTVLERFNRNFRVHINMALLIFYQIGVHLFPYDVSTCKYLTSSLQCT